MVNMTYITHFSLNVILYLPGEFSLLSFPEFYENIIHIQA